MKQDEITAPGTQIPISILLADDDSDDRMFFEKILRIIPIATRLVTVGDGEKLMTYLSQNSGNLPDVLFLDHNMPRKNGSECLIEIKLSEKLKQLPVIIYSTSLYDDVADLLYKNGAQYCFRKTDLTELQQVIHKVLTMIVEKKFIRPARDQFIISMAAV